nr:MAG TPA: restriction alleviation protein [Caudoviricetes sp.]
MCGGEVVQKLKPCPFCKGKVNLIHGFRNITFFKCEKCKAIISFDGNETEEKAIKCFNRRVEQK